MNQAEKIAGINERLPQTQCGECGYAGCLPYARAIAQNEAEIDKCPPGGISTLTALAGYLDRDPTPYLGEMKVKSPTKVRIREVDCIGCTKCIKACPVDAIIGAAKQMHTVISAECTGCELCVAPCPVDCIEVIPLPASDGPAIEPAHSVLAKTRYENRQARLARVQSEQFNQHQQAKASPQLKGKSTVERRQAYIEAALARVKHKKEQR